MLRRVSSRQRLFSWDAFDATVIAESDEERDDFVTYYGASPARQSPFVPQEPLVDESHSGMTVPMTISTVSRKRERYCSEPSAKTFAPLPVVIPTLTGEFEDPTSLDNSTKKLSLKLDELTEDVQLHIFSFLSVQDARIMASVSKHYRQFLYSDEAVSLVTEWIRRRWPSFSLVDGRNVVDILHIPIAVCGSKEVNFGVLFGHAARHQPTGFDKSLLVPPPSSTRHLRMFTQDTTTSLFRILESSVQYTGPVGRGERCIRGDKPLAGPQPNKGLLGSCAKKVSETSALDIPYV